MYGEDGSVHAFAKVVIKFITIFTLDMKTNS